MVIQALIDALSASDPQISEAARKVLAAQGEQAVDALIQALPQMLPRTLVKAISLLALVPEARCEAALLGLLEHHHNLVRLSSVQALGNFPSAQVGQALIHHLNSDDVLLQISAVTSLGKVGGSAAVDALLALLLRTPESTVRYSTIRALGQLGDARAIEVIRGFADDPNHHVRADVRQALQRLGAPYED